MRTCVTTTPIRHQLPPLLQPPMEQAHLGNGTAESSSVPAAFRSRPPGTPAFISRNGSDRSNTQIKLLARHAAPPSGCFNSVKRRQLERLQKRSDWFLSPPSGLRSSGLIHLDPGAVRGGK
ncbi:hypothetical protein PHET_11027 [Paragonimus heterotremus]|uniref:Uncharacterized protein n=1 Tax=Paragonimus heterotremus TaxID=100268 RepID=A0A8J4SIR4_9TREM|nr:hypothetical protein PHET_11026 [Paragonimus heterotremus]KAF5394591.1 hypothetical protein PHET_11027 [Paragonimus heterotremus]